MEIPKTELPNGSLVCVCLVAKPRSYTMDHPLVKDHSQYKQVSTIGISSKGKKSKIMKSKPMILYESAPDSHRVHSVTVWSEL